MIMSIYVYLQLWVNNESNHGHIIVGSRQELRTRANPCNLPLFIPFSRSFRFIVRSLKKVVEF